MTVKLKQKKDFKTSEYYEHYCKTIESYGIDLIKEILENNNNEVKYTWNDVLKMVFRFVNGDLKDFKDKVDLNPITEERDKEEEERLIEEQAIQLMNGQQYNI